MSSSARWPSGWTRRWAVSRGRVHRRPEGTAPDPVCDLVPGVEGQPGLVLQVAARRRLTEACPAGAAEGRDRSAVRGAPRHLRLAADHYGPPGGRLAGQPEHGSDADG